MDKELKLPIVIEALEYALNLYLGYSTLLQRYMVNPSAVIEELAGSTNEELANTFGNVKLGLKGDFTRSKAIDIGRQAIFNVIIQAKDMVASAYNDALDINKYPTIEVFATHDIIMNNTDTYTLAKRKEAYNANEVTVEYLHNKLMGMSVEILKDIDDKIEFKEFLYKLNMALDMLNKKRDTTYFSMPLHRFKQSSEYSAIMKDIVHTDKYTHTECTLIPYDDLSLLNENELFVSLLSTIKAPEVISKSTLSLLDEAIDKLPAALEDIRNSVRLYGENIGKMKDVKTVFLATLTEFGEKYIIPCSQSEITTGEYDIGLSNYSNFLEIQITDMSNAFANVSYLANEIMKDLKLYMHSYSLLDMMSFTGTVGRYSVNSK